MSEFIQDHELPDELPERFKGSKSLQIHYNYGRDGGGGIYLWYGEDRQAWPIQEQYDTRKPKPAKGKTPAFEPNKSGLVIIDKSQPSGFYGEVVSSYSELREVWKQWRIEKKVGAA
jgi:hypothetical protein